MENCYETEALAKNSSFLQQQSIRIYVNDDVKYVTTTYKGISTNRHKVNLDKWVSRQELNIPKYALPPGLYEVQIHFSFDDVPGNAGTSPPFDDKCYINVKALPPKVIITGGHSRQVPSFANIKVNGSKSFDTNYKDSSSKGLQYAWTCTQKLNPTFCSKKPVSTKNAFTIPAEFAMPGEEFALVLEVTSSFGSKAKESQVVAVVEQSAQLEISCERNCPPETDAPNFQVDTLVVVKCVATCEEVTAADFRWSVFADRDDYFDFDYKKSSAYGRSGDKFLIKKDNLVPGWYEVVVELRETATQRGQASLRLFYSSPPDVKNCRITPDHGNNLETDFYLSCEQNTTEDCLYELYAINGTDSNDKRLLIGEHYPAVTKIPLKLPISNGLLFALRVTTSTRPSYKTRIAVNVVSATKNKTPEQVLKIIDDVYSGQSSNFSVVQLVHGNDPNAHQRGLQVLRALIDAAVTNNLPKDQFDAFRSRVMDDVIATSFNSMDEIVSTAESVAKLASLPGEETNADAAKEISAVCRKFAVKYLEKLQDLKFPRKLATMTKELASTLDVCADSSTKEQLETLVKRINATDGDDAQLDEEFYENVDILKEATDNVINSKTIAAKAMALSGAVGEEINPIVKDKGAIVVIKDTGLKLTDRKYGAKGVVLVPSDDFANETFMSHPFDILMSVWERDIMWWNPHRTKVATSIVKFEFWHSTCKAQIFNFTKPAKLFFAVKPAPVNQSWVSSFEIEIPNGYLSKSEDELDRIVFVCRATVPNRYSLLISFLHVSQEHALKFVVVYNKFPTADDFHEDVLITTNSSVSVPNRMGYNAFIYLAILPRRNFVEHNPSVKNVTLNVTFRIASCIRWNNVKTNWISACQPGEGGNGSIISCECYNFQRSVLAGYVQYVKAIRQKVEDVEMVLMVQSTHIVYFTLVATLAIYLALVIFVLKKRRKLAVYYLADNNRRHLFAYLLIIRTGSSWTAGTTSNVTIKIHGTKDISDPHVLNFPDPKLRMLQQLGTDHFVLTTANHLGELTSIELWLDFVGDSPSWFCKDVVVYDMQQHVEWTFKIHKRFSVVFDRTHVEAATYVPKPKKLHLSFAMLHDHTWMLWASGKRMSHTIRLVVMLSTTLLIYVAVLFVFGVPALQARDCLDNESYHLGPVVVCVGFLIGFVAFFLHFGIAWTFRMAQLPENQTGLHVEAQVALLLVMVTFITLSTSFLVVVGFWLPLKRSLHWLTSSLIALFLGVFIYEFLFIIFQEFACSVRHQKDAIIYYRIWESTEQLRWYLYKVFGDHLLRPYFAHLYKPLSRRAIQKKLLFLKTRLQIITEMQELAMCAVYLIILYALVASNQDVQKIKSRNDLKDVMHGRYTRTLDFLQLEHMENAYEYFNETLIPIMHPAIWYNGSNITEALMVDVAHQIVGVVRLRQKRIKQVTCEVAPAFRFLNLTCRADLGPHSEEYGTFGYRWESYKSYMVHDPRKTMWQYYANNDFVELMQGSEISVYKGGGYMTLFERTLSKSCEVFNALIQKLWIDDHTAVLFVEFLTYNVNANYFSSVRLLVEQSVTGFTNEMLRVDCARMIFRESEYETVPRIMFYIFLVWIVVMLVLKVASAISNYKTCYKNVWLLIDFGILFVSIFSLMLLVIRSSVIGTYMKELEKLNEGEFLEYFLLFHLEDLLNLSGGILVCMTTLRLWTFLRFAKMFRGLELTLRLAMPIQMAALLLFAVMILAFAVTLMPMLGNDFIVMASFIHIFPLLITSCFRAVLMHFGKYIHYSWAMFYIVLFAILGKFIIFLFATITFKSYKEAYLKISASPHSYHMNTFVYEQLEYMPKYFKYKHGRIKAGQDVPKVIPKPQKFFYSNAVTIPAQRMLSMKYVTLCVIRNIKHWKRKECTDSDCQLMMQTCTFLLSGAKKIDVDVFYKSVHSKEHVKLVDEKRIDMMANIATLMLEEERQEEETQYLEEYRMKMRQCIHMIKNNQTTLDKCNLELWLLLYKVNSIHLDYWRLMK